MKRRPDVYVSESVIQYGEAAPFPSKKMLGIRLSVYNQAMSPDEARSLAQEILEAADRADFGNTGKS